MTTTHPYIKRSCIALLTLSLLAPVPVVHGDDGEFHDVDSGHAEVELTISQMEHMVTLLQQLVAFLTEYRALSFSPAPSVAEVNMEEHHDVHGEEEDGALGAPALALVIEVEAHFDKTHVHVRHADKPEDMFFANAAITDEEGIVAETAARTGLSAETVRAALKYMQ